MSRWLVLSGVFLLAAPGPAIGAGAASGPVECRTDTPADRLTSDAIFDHANRFRYGAGRHLGGRRHHLRALRRAPLFRRRPMRVAPVVLHCPVCRARFRGTRECSRCGADLEPLMILAVRAHHAREAARRALERGEIARAHELATAAQRMHATPEGRRLCRLAAWWFGLDDGPATHRRAGRLRGC